MGVHIFQGIPEERLSRYSVRIEVSWLHLEPDVVDLYTQMRLFLNGEPTDRRTSVAQAIPQSTEWERLAPEYIMDITKAGQPTYEQLVAERDALQARLKALPTPSSIMRFKVSEKKALSLYGMGRFPVTLYASQWRTVSQLVTSGELAKVLEANKEHLAEKPVKE